jgi:hypothetical protein
MGNTLKPFNPKFYTDRGYHISYFNLAGDLYYKDNQGVICIHKYENKNYSLDIISIKNNLPKTYKIIKKMIELKLGFLIEHYSYTSVSLNSNLILLENNETRKWYYTTENLDNINSQIYSFRYFANDNYNDLYETYLNELKENNKKLKEQFEKEKKIIEDSFLKLKENKETQSQEIENPPPTNPSYEENENEGEEGSEEGLI